MSDGEGTFSELSDSALSDAGDHDDYDDDHDAETGEHDAETGEHRHRGRGDAPPQRLPQPDTDARSDAPSSPGSGDSSPDVGGGDRRHAWAAQRRLSQRLAVARELTQKLSPWQLAELADMAEGAPPPEWLQELEEDTLALLEDGDVVDAADASDGRVRLEMAGGDGDGYGDGHGDGAAAPLAPPGAHPRPGLVLRQPLS